MCAEDQGWNKDLIFEEGTVSLLVDLTCPPITTCSLSWMTIDRSVGKLVVAGLSFAFIVTIQHRSECAVNSIDQVLKNDTTFRPSASLIVDPDLSIVWFGCENGHLVEVKDGSVLLKATTPICSILRSRIRDEIVVITKGREVYRSSSTTSTKSRQWTNLGLLLNPLEEVRGALLMADDDFIVHWTTKGFLYVTTISKLSATRQVPVTGGRVLNARKLSETLIAVEQSNRSWVAYSLVKDDNDTVTQRDLHLLLDRLRQFEPQEREISRGWQDLEDRSLMVSLASRLPQEKTAPVQFIKRLSDRFRFEVQLPSTTSKVNKSCSLIAHFSFGNARQETVSKSVPPGCKSMEIELAMAPPPCPERLLPIHVKAVVVIPFNVSGFVHVLDERTFRLLDTGVLAEDDGDRPNAGGDGDDDDDDYGGRRPPRSVCAIRIIKVTRDRLSSPSSQTAFTSPHPAQHVMGLCVPIDSWTLSASASPFRCFASLGRTRIQVEIDGDVVEIKAVCKNELVAACVRAAILNRLLPHLSVGTANSRISSLAIQRAIVDAESAIEDVGLDGDCGDLLAANERARDALEKTLKAWITARASSSSD